MTIHTNHNLHLSEMQFGLFNSGQTRQLLAGSKEYLQNIRSLLAIVKERAEVEQQATCLHQARHGG